MNFPKLYECDPQKNTECNKRNCGNPWRIILDFVADFVELYRRAED